MLRLSKLADYGTVVMVYLARHPEQFCNARVLAAHTHLGVPTVSKLLKILANANLVASQRGTKGGYKLSRSAAQISITHIIAAVEERTGLTECSHHGSQCVLQPVCSIRDNWQILSHAITEALESVSLSALAQPRFKVHEVDVSRIKQLHTSME